MRIRFVADYTVKAIDGQTYKKGALVDLDELSAQHFINRQVAVASDAGAIEQANMEAPEHAVPARGKPRKMKDDAADRDAG